MVNKCRFGRYPSRGICSRKGVLMRYAVVVAALLALAPVVAVSSSTEADCRGDCVGNGNARDGRECFNEFEVQTLQQIVPVMVGNGTSCPEQQTIIGAKLSRATDGDRCYRVDTFYCPTAVSGDAGGVRLERQPRECFNSDEALDFAYLRRTIQVNGTVCPADHPVMAGVKLQQANGCWRVPAAYCHVPTGLLAKAGFEEYAPPALGAPGWVSDSIRQIAAKSETNQPHSGAQNGACWSTSNLDCGIYQEVIAPESGQYTFSIFANTDKTASLIGVNVNGLTRANGSVTPRGFGQYGAPYTLTFSALRGDTIRVWAYSDQSPGYVVIDDATLTINF
jgi:hypothetical protein